jgi:hypothetical protein
MGWKEKDRKQEGKEIAKGMKRTGTIHLGQPQTCIDFPFVN